MLARAILAAPVLGFVSDEAEPETGTLSGLAALGASADGALVHHATIGMVLAAVEGEGGGGLGGGPIGGGPIGGGETGEGVGPGAASGLTAAGSFTRTLMLSAVGSYGMAGAVTTSHAAALVAQAAVGASGAAAVTHAAALGASVAVGVSARGVFFADVVFVSRARLGFSAVGRFGKGATLTSRHVRIGLSGSGSMTAFQPPPAVIVVPARYLITGPPANRVIAGWTGSDA